MENLRKYGKAPFNVAVIHGGPGAAGEMAPVARELSLFCGILEPLQTAISIKGQVKELKTILEEYGNPPVMLLGFSWGAWLSFIFTAHYPQVVKKLILIGSGPFQEKYAEKIQDTRLSRLDEQDRMEIQSVIEILNNAGIKDKKNAFARFGALFSKADSYDPVKSSPEEIDFRVDIHQKVWNEAAEMRRHGDLLKLGKYIQCPVLAIHGDHDPHPADGVQTPLAKIMKNFRFILLRNCGHKPWIERHARKDFFQILEKELK